MEDWDGQDFPLPGWAIGKSSGNYMEIGAQLCTKDGRKCGNAFVNYLWKSHGVEVADIITDAGTKMIMNLYELKESFYEPEYIMDITEARNKFCK